MTKTTVSPLIHSPEEHSIVAMPDDETIERIVAIQHQLKSLLGDVIWLTPPHTLHITLMEVICNAEYQGLSREEHFTNWYERYNQKTKETITQFQPFEITFNELYASPAAFILKASDSDYLNTIRTRLLAIATLPAQTKLPPTITHFTIARYNEEVNLEEVRTQTNVISVDFKTSIDAFKLMTDLGPDFRPKVEETYRLSS